MADDIKVDEKSEAVEVASSSAERLLNGLAKTEDAARISSESFEKLNPFFAFSELYSPPSVKRILLYMFNNSWSSNKHISKG